jgi:hypothetical protein
MKNVYSQRKTLLFLALSCMLVWSCGEKKEMGPKEQQAIQMVKAFTPEGNLFSVISNIEKQTKKIVQKNEVAKQFSPSDKTSG